MCFVVANFAGEIRHIAHGFVASVSVYSQQNSCMSTQCVVLQEMNPDTPSFKHVLDISYDSAARQGLELWLPHSFYTCLDLTESAMAVRFVHISKVPFDVTHSELWSTLEERETVLAHG